MTPRAKAGSKSARSDPQKSAVQPGNRRREPAEFYRKHQDQQDPEPELGGGEPKLGEEHDRHVPGAILVPGGEDPQGQRDEDGENHGEQRHWAGDRKAAQNQVEHGHLVVNGLVALPGEQSGDPLQVLAQEGLVHPELRPQGGQGLGGRVDSQDDLGRVARQDKEHREDRNGDQPQEQEQGD
jgi:hypothetical protein